MAQPYLLEAAADAAAGQITNFGPLQRKKAGLSACLFLLVDENSNLINIYNLVLLLSERIAISGFLFRNGFEERGQRRDGEIRLSIYFYLAQ